MPSTFGDGLVLQTNNEYGTRGFLNGFATADGVGSVSIADITEGAQFDAVRKALEENEVTVARASLPRIPQNSVPVEGKTAGQLIRLLEALEGN